jgi:ribosomal protein L29
MSLPKYKELSSLTNVGDIDQEIFLLQKELFELRITQARKQAFKSHLFAHTKRRIAQLKFKKFSVLKTTQTKEKKNG